MSCASPAEAGERGPGKQPSSTACTRQGHADHTRISKRIGSMHCCDYHIAGTRCLNGCGPAGKECTIKVERASSLMSCCARPAGCSSMSSTTRALNFSPIARDCSPICSRRAPACRRSRHSFFARPGHRLVSCHHVSAIRPSTSRFAIQTTVRALTRAVHRAAMANECNGMDGRSNSTGLLAV